MNPFSKYLSREARSDVPFSRVIIRDGRLYFAQWSPSMMVLQSEFPMYEAVAANGVKIVDVSREANDGVREFFAIPIHGHTLDQADAELLVRHSAITGYHRAWIGNEHGVFDLPGLVPFGAVATVTCDHCGWSVEDSGPGIWNFVASNNAFPSRCFACGQSVAAWQVESAEDANHAPSDLFDSSWESTWKLESELELRAAASEPAVLSEPESFDEADEWFGDEPPTEYDV